MVEYEQPELFESDDWHCLATLPLKEGGELHCIVTGRHTTHRFAIDVDL
jgi:hypothetical protein